MSVRADSRIGTELAGYRIERLLGRGGMGVVYLAHDPRLERRVALKLLSPSLAEDSEFRARFLRESKLAASLDHQNVVPIFEAGEAEGTLFIAMRYVEGTDLREVLREKGRLEPERTIVLLAQVADALDAAHEHGLIHRDVKPANILLAADEHVYLGDFGLTRRVEDPDAGPAAGNSLGTVDYVAPEQIEGDPVDGRADVYSLGCVLYECLTGTPPFSSSSPMGVLWEHVQAEPPSATETESGLPVAIDPVITHALAKHAEDRQPTCRELIDDAGEALGLTRAPRRRLLFTLTILALAVIAAAITIPLTLNQADTGSPTAKPPDTKPTLAINRDSVQHIDPATNMLVGTTQLGGHITQVAIGEGAVWVADPVPLADTVPSATVYRLAPSTGEVTGRTPGGTASTLAAGLGEVWVVDNYYSDGTLRRIGPRTLASSGVPLSLKSARTSGGGPIAVGKSVWVVATACLQGGVVHCIPDTSVWAIGGRCDPRCYIRTAFAPLYVRGIAVADGTLWLSGYLDVKLRAGKLERVDEATNRYQGSTRLDFLPAAGIAAADGAVWIADPIGGRLVRIDAATRRVVARIAVGRGPSGVAVGAGGVWVTNYDDGTVSRIDPETNTVVGTIEVGPHPDHIAAGEGGVWVAVDPL